MSQRCGNSESQKRIIDVIDYTNIDDFFNQPSPDELTATSERRVNEIIEDLKRRTIEELERWSWNPSIEESIEVSKFSDHTTEDTKVVSDKDMVSPPVFLQPAPLSSPSSESNCPAAVPIEPKMQSRSKSSRSTRIKTSPSSPQNKFLRASDGNHKSYETTVKVAGSRNPGKTYFRPLAIRRGTNPPPPMPIIARDFAYQCPRTPLEDPRTPPLPPPVTPATPSAALQQIAEFEQIMNLLGHPKVDQTLMWHEETPVPFVQALVASGTNTSSSPIQVAPVMPLRIKRKPLPADSPLFVPLKGHPVFAKTVS